MKKIIALTLVVLFLCPFAVTAQEGCDCEVSLTTNEHAILGCCLYAYHENCTGLNIDYNWTLNGNDLVFPTAQNHLCEIGTQPVLQPGTYSVTITDITGCTATDEITLGENICACAECELTLSVEEDCQLRICAMGECAEPNTFYMTYEGNIINSWVIPPFNRPCRQFPMEQNGEYCITHTDFEGCESTKCIDIDCAPCDDNPSFLEPKLEPSLSWACVGGPSVRMGVFLGLYPKCDDCCWDMPNSERNIKIAVDWMVENLTKNSLLVSSTYETEVHSCGGLINQIGVFQIPCPSVDEGDIVKYSWVVSYDNMIGCSYIGPNPIVGSLTEAVPPYQIIVPCCTN